MDSSIASINVIRRHIVERHDLASIRCEIIELLYIGLTAKEHSMDDWEKTHFSNAIGALSLNIHSPRQPTYSWLRLCLVDLERALAPAHLRIANYQSPDASMRDVKCELLMAAVESLGLGLAST
jgi:hypothetical protein